MDDVYMRARYDWAGLRGEWPGITVRTLKAFNGDKVTGNESTIVGVQPSQTGFGCFNIRELLKVKVSRASDVSSDAVTCLDP
ncbi:hypothetical protein MTR_0404s0040 [Medicago truncatula]|uniref:Uncharacterized protein n=1 Tax=Medicago truncatula TaxID=3880 RepID=A0A072TEK2_MEDTR|nr:hypothetical protein MTR_0404s0040 [Medicago truncatula]